MIHVVLFAVPGERTDSVRSLLQELDAALTESAVTVGQIDDARRAAFTGVRSRSCGMCSVPLGAWESLVALAGEWSAELGGHLIPSGRYQELANLRPSPAALTAFFSQAAESSWQVIRFTASEEDPWSEASVGGSNG